MHIVNRLGKTYGLVRRRTWIKHFRVSSIVFAALLANLTGCGSSDTTANSPSQDELMQGIVTLESPETAESRAAKKVKLEENLASARKATQDGDLDRAIVLLEESLSLDAKHREVLMMLVQTSQARSKSALKEDAWRSYRLIVQAGGYMRTLREAYPELSDAEKTVMADVLFDEACAHARSKRREEFSGSLSAALAAGFKDVERLNSDPDLEEFRKIPEMAAVLKNAADSIK